MIFRAYYSHLRVEDGKPREKQEDLIFQTETRDEAVAAFKRWWDNRHKTMPSYFAELLAVKISVFSIPTINDKGKLEHPGLSFQFYEWKIDYGVPYGSSWGTRS